MGRLVSLLALLLVSGSTSFGAVSMSIDLGGAWQSIALDRPSFPPPDAPGWVDVELPRPVNATPWVCQRRTLDIPAELAGQRLYLRFQGVKYTAQVRCNGVEVGRNVGGYRPFECDITGVAQAGAPNVVEVLSGSWRELATEPFREGPLGRDGIEEAGDGVLYPVGSRITSMGIWDTVTLEARPAVYVEGVYVTTSVRRKQITVETTVRNTGDGAVEVTIDQRVLRDDEPIHTIGMRTVRVKAGESATVSQRSQWPDPPLWWPHDPVLLHLETGLGVGGEPVDRHRQRFGFREIQTQGPLFVLNGTPLHLLGSSCHPLGYTREDAMRVYDICRQGNVNCFRLHAQPWTQAWYDVADETGMLIIHETAVWCFARSYALADERFWANFADHIRAQIGLHRNQPSVIAWSLENEMLHVGGSRVPETEQRLADLASVAREVDATRLINYDGDEDPKGAADIINLHYAHNFPKSRLWPDACYWLDTRRVIDGWPRKEWLWSRKKPLYIGEYLWSPGSTPDRYSLFCGDEAYTDLSLYRRVAKAQAWRYQIEAYRAQGLSGGCPWNIFEGGRMEPSENPMYEAATLAYRPQCALIREWNTRFFPGQRIERTVTFINDVLRPATLRAEWACIKGGRETFRDGIDLAMEPAQIRQTTVTLEAPESRDRERFEMVFTLSEKGEEIFRESRECWVMPRSRAPEGDGDWLAVYDPGGAIGSLLEDGGAVYRDVADIAGLPEGVRGLIVGENALAGEVGRMQAVVGAEPDAISTLQRFVEEGGRAIVLAQDGMPGALPVDLMPDGSTIGFVRRPGHPLVSGLEADDFKLWARDHLVSRRDLRRPEKAGALPIVDAGGEAGLERALLLEVRAGKGSYVFCQLALTDNYDSEPVAPELLSRLVQYALADRPEPPQPALVVEEGNAAADALRAVGAVFQVAGGEKLDLADRAAAIVEGDDPRAAVAASDLQQFAQDGGTVWLHRPSPDFLARLGLQWDAVSWEAASTAPVQAMPESCPLAEGLKNEDLYWLSDTRPTRHADWALTPQVISHVLRPRLTEDARQIPAETLDNSTVPITRRAPEGIWLSTRGTLTAPISIPEAGRYVIGVEAGGTPAEGIFPAFAVRVDDRTLGGFATDGAEPRLYTVAGDLTAGEHELQIAFVNDRQVSPQEDRNGLVAGARYARAAPLPDGMKLMTSPGALFAVAAGRGQYLIDGVNWPATGLNALRATRLLATLATNAGIAAQTVSRGTPIPLADWRLQEGIEHLRHTDDGGLYLGNTGWAEGTVRFEEAGRYRLVLEVRGTEAEGEFPEIELYLDGEPIGTQHLISASWHDLPFDADVEQGEHTIRMRFTNDLWDPAAHLDRNFWLRRLYIARADE